MKLLGVIALGCTVACFSSLQLHHAEAATERVIHSFCSQSACADGNEPVAGLVKVKGQLYGTAMQGGSGYCGSFSDGCGIIFSLGTRTGSERVVYSFGVNNAYDGAYPYAGLIAASGTLYGTTYDGGAYCPYSGCGTVFSFDPKTGAESVLHSFGNGNDGQYPYGTLIDGKRMLYGTTEWGGSNRYGTVFSLDPKTGAETVLYSFCSQPNCSDGEEPQSGLVYENGALFGTTPYGGPYGGRCTYNSCGVVFSVDPATGVEKVVYAFCSATNCADGSYPVAGLIAVKGLLYGTTWTGGASGKGTVFSLDPNTGVEKVVYSFCSQANCADGAGPVAALINVKGTLYGTTGGGGGGADCSSDSGCGTVFSLDPRTGAEKVVYAFCSEIDCKDGNGPAAGVIEVNGVIYGTTVGGGTGCSGVGCGTVYDITP